MKVKSNVQAAASRLGIEKLRKFQINPINSVLDKHDTMVIAPTSAGKSAVYQVPALIGEVSHKWTLVIEPTLALIADQVRKLQKLGIAAEMLTSQNNDKHVKILEALQAKKVSIVYITPERLRSFNFHYVVQNNPPWLAVIDEAHCVLDWGFTFRRDYLQIKEFIGGLKRRPVIIALTATAPPKYRDIIKLLLGMKQPNAYVSDLTRSNLILLKEDCSRLSIKRRMSRVTYNIMKYGEDGRVIVYCATRKNVDAIFNYLKKKFPGQVVKCHAYMEQEKRDKYGMLFINGTKSIMVATTAFGMGVDVPDIRLVVHFNLPLSAIDYYQQVGRAGRDGNRSHAVLLHDPKDIELNKHVLKKENLSETAQKWQQNRLTEMASIAEGDECLMQRLLEALGEKDVKKCRYCTNCQKKKR